MVGKQRPQPGFDAERHEQNGADEQIRVARRIEARTRDAAEQRHEHHRQQEQIGEEPKVSPRHPGNAGEELGDDLDKVRRHLDRHDAARRQAPMVEHLRVLDERPQHDDAGEERHEQPPDALADVVARPATGQRRRRHHAADEEEVFHHPGAQEAADGIELREPRRRFKVIEVVGVEHADRVVGDDDQTDGEAQSIEPKAAGGLIGRGRHGRASWVPPRILRDS